MRQMKILLLGSIAVLVILLIQPQSVFADWANSFVVYDGNNYTITDEVIQPERIGKKLGTVTHYSDREGTYRGNFSNTFPKGTKYYAVKEVGYTSKLAIQTPQVITSSPSILAHIFSKPMVKRLVLVHCYFNRFDHNDRRC